jgi:hypothetical protein
MKGIVIDRPSMGDLADEFRKALDVLCDDGLKPGSGTRLLSRYAVIAVDDGLVDRAIAHLRSANISAATDSH